MVDPDSLSESMLDCAGFFGGELIPHVKHHFFTTLLLLIPDYFRTMIIKNVYKNLKNKLE
jgi:hypothetical protein